MQEEEHPVKAEEKAHIPHRACSITGTRIITWMLPLEAGSAKPPLPKALHARLLPVPLELGIAQLTQSTSNHVMFVCFVGVLQLSVPRASLFFSVLLWLC